MANYDNACDVTLQFEGGYSNNPSDNGGETFAGIARNYFPDWEGWDTLDKYQTKVQKNQLLKDKNFMNLVKDWYKINFWDKIHGDEIQDDAVAKNIFDFGVNAGIKKSTQKTQLVLGITSDGIFGKRTLQALNAFDPDDFVNSFKQLRIAFYEAVAQRNPQDAQFLDGWKARANEC